MTFRSLTVERHESRDSAQAPYRVDRGCHLILSLNAFTFSKSLHSFAAEQNLPMSYVDNAWLRVDIDGCSLKRFLELGRRTEADLDRQLDTIEDQRWFVVNEEEL